MQSFLFLFYFLALFRLYNVFFLSRRCFFFFFILFGSTAFLRILDTGTFIFWYWQPLYSKILAK